MTRRFTSVTIGKMPGLQVIVYDKHADITAKRKIEWWKIWDTHRAVRGKPPLCPDDCKKAVWRVEFRAGKRHLKDRWNLVTWADFEQKVASVFQAMAEQIRLCPPTDDSNRARWPNAPLWDLAQAELAKAMPIDTPVDPSSIRTVIRDKQEALLQSQHLGLAASWAHLSGIDPAEPRKALNAITACYEGINGDELIDFENKMKRAKERYVFLDS